MSDTEIDITGLDRAAVLKALYDGTSELGMGRLHAVPGGLTIDECRAAVDQHDYFDYLAGRPLKISLPEGATTVDVRLYDRDSHTPGAVAIAALRDQVDA